MKWGKSKIKPWKNGRRCEEGEPRTKGNEEYNEELEVKPKIRQLKNAIIWKKGEKRE